jgi:cytochrome c biogenesis protein CcmG/thiol:disulfide interchange protein DsbE
MRVLPFLLAAFVCVSPVRARAADRPAVADWSLRTADGGEVRFTEALARGPVVVSFWALWCRPCLLELPHLDELARAEGDSLTVLAVNIDSPKSVAKVRPYLKSKGYALTVPLDTSGEVSRLLQVGKTVPFLVLYDTAGREVYRHIGYKEGDERELQSAVARLLGAPSDSTAPGEKE